MAKSSYEIQDTSGNWTPYTGTGSGNIRSGGTTYSNYAGQQAYANEADDPAPADPGPIPTNPDGSQVGGGTPWEEGASAPSSAPPGYHWDANLAMFQPDDAAPDTGGGATPPPVETPPPTSGGAPPPQTAPPPTVAPPAVPSGGTSGGEQAPAAGGPTPPQVYQPPSADQSAFGKAIRDALLKALGQPNVTADDPEIAPAIAANRVATERSLQQQRDAIAERLNAQGMGGSGALDQQMAQAFENSGTQQGLFAGNAVLQQATARRQQLMSLLQTGAGIMNADEAQALQAKIADLDAFLRQQTITNQNTQFNSGLNLSAEQFRRLLERQTILDATGG